MATRTARATRAARERKLALVPSTTYRPTSTVGRGRSVTLRSVPKSPLWKNKLVSLHHGDSLELYDWWDAPTTIVSDGGYGILGFEGDTSDHLELPAWYAPHVEAWTRSSSPQTTLWFWNSEIGWAAVHPVLERHGWRYQNCNVWNKGLAHIAGNVNTQKIRRFPVVSEVCVQYTLEGRVNGRELKHWLRDEWRRSGLPLREANVACGVADAAVRKYLDVTHVWYFPPPEMFERMQSYANRHGDPEGRPYFSIDGKTPASGAEWSRMRAQFNCPHGVTNVWNRNPVNGEERIRAPSGKAVHLNQKPLDIMRMLIAATSSPGDVIWEPFGGLFSASYAACQLGRRSFSAEIDPTYYQYGVARFSEGVKEIEPIALSQGRRALPFCRSHRRAKKEF